MPTSRPYTFKRQAILTANNSGQISIINSLSLVFHGKRWLWTSTGTFNMVDISINNSTHLVDASVANPIKSAALQQQASPNFNWDRFEQSLDVLQQETLIFNLVDTSGGGNTVELTLIGIMDFP